MLRSTQAERVLIADDHPLTCEGLALAVRAARAGVIVDTAGTIAEAERLLKERGGAYRLVVLDLLLPDATGFSGMMRLQAVAPDVPMVMISASDGPALVEAARALGAAGFLTKSRSLDEIATQLRAVDAGRPVFPSAAAPAPGLARARARLAELSPAQTKVLAALADGRLNKQIAGDLGITEATVKAHLSAIFRKLGVDNRTQALLLMQPLFGGIAPAAPQSA